MCVGKPAVVRLKRNRGEPCRFVRAACGVGKDLRAVFEASAKQRHGERSVVSFFAVLELF